MKYELAKQLKDAGFPQKYGNFMTEEGCVFDIPSKNRAHLATLDELIIAVDKLRDKRKVSDFEIKNRIYNGGAEMQWAASLAYPPEPRIIEMGNTPTEAVAHLWLSLISLVAPKRIQGYIVRD